MQESDEVVEPETFEDAYVPPPTTGFSGLIFSHVEQQDPVQVLRREEFPPHLSKEDIALALHYRGSLKPMIQRMTGLTRSEVEYILETNMAERRKEIDQSPAAIKSELLSMYFQMMDTGLQKAPQDLDPAMMRSLVVVGREIALLTGIREPIRHTHQVNQISVNVDGNKPIPAGVLKDPTMRALQLAIENRRIELESGENGKDDILLNS